MNPLFEKYFFGELTESEETKLEKLLTESEEAAWEFGQAAEETYVRYGLPEPDLPKGPGAGPATGVKPWMWMGPMVVVALGTYWWWSKPVPVSVQPVKETVIQSISRPMGKPVHRTVVPPVKKEAAPLETRVISMETPAEPPVVKQVGNNLKVVVNQDAAGPVTVRVVDQAGLEVRRLHGGILEQGHWPFGWDGRKDNGVYVEPGKYRIQVETGGTTQSKEVIIH